MKKVTITITGEQGSGKTYLFKLILTILTLHNIYKKIGSVINLDKNQEQAILGNEFHNVIIKTKQL